MNKNAILVATLLILGLTPVVAVRANSINVTVSVTPDILWPPHHQYIEVVTVVTIYDPSDPSPTLTFVSVTSNEPDDGLADGRTVNDIVIIDDFTFKLRAERAATGPGRVYTITYQVTNMFGDSVTASATVAVPLRM